MMNPMDRDLRFLVHFFNDERYLFKTITMAGPSHADDICQRITSQRGWFWMRFSPSERRGYLSRRHFVERAMYEDFTQRYGSLKEKVPVYFYLVPNITEQKAMELARQRTRHGETEPRVLMVELRDIEDITNMTFTLNDSHVAYRRRVMEAGMDFGGDTAVPEVLPDHDRVFPFSMIGPIHRRYAAHRISYEVQIWDHERLADLKYTVLADRRT
jgi:hypothetical protein